MGRLKTLRPALGSAPSRLKPPQKIADRFYTSPEWRALIKEIKQERGNWCSRCGSDKHVIGDHIKERKDGGAPLDKDNVQLLCLRCHNTKTHRERARRALGQT